MSTFITRFDTSGPGVRLAVKDLIDMEGVPTTAGCRAVANEAEAAFRDAACLHGARAAGARIVGRTNLHELALGVTGVNPWYGTPVNPLDPRLVPGGSSSGSAVAVATHEADVAYGSDTGGSVRIPAACCGTAGLKTTWGRVSLDGVWPLSPSFDTVGPMARDVGGLVLGMELLEPGFTVAARAPVRVGRLRVDADPVIDAAIDAALAASEWEVSDIELPRWHEATAAGGLLLVAEAWETDRALVARRPEEIGADVVGRLKLGGSLDAKALASARVDAPGVACRPRRDVPAGRCHRHSHPDGVPSGARRGRRAADGALHDSGQPGRRACPRPSGADVGPTARQCPAHRPPPRRGDAPGRGTRPRIGHLDVVTRRRDVAARRRQTMQRLSSAKLVVPARTLSIPFSRSRCVPSATAASSITAAEACSRMSVRMRAVTTMTS